MGILLYDALIDWNPGHAVHADLRGKDADWRSGDVLLLGWRDRLSVLP